MVVLIRLITLITSPNQTYTMKIITQFSAFNCLFGGKILLVINLVGKKWARYQLIGLYFIEMVVWKEVEEV